MTVTHALVQQLESRTQHGNTITETISAHTKFKHKQGLRKSKAATTRRSSADGAVHWLSTFPNKEHIRNQIGPISSLVNCE